MSMNKVEKIEPQWAEALQGGGVFNRIARSMDELRATDDEAWYFTRLQLMSGVVLKAFRVSAEGETQYPPVGDGPKETVTVHDAMQRLYGDYSQVLEEERTIYDYMDAGAVIAGMYHQVVERLIASDDRSGQ